MIEMMIGMALAEDNLRHHPRFPKKLQERVVVEVAVDKDSDDVTETRHESHSSCGSSYLRLFSFFVFFTFIIFINLFNGMAKETPVEKMKTTVGL